MSWSPASGRREAESRLRQIGGLADDAIDLAPAALALAALEQPQASLERYQHHLSLLARDTADAAASLGAATDLEARGEALRQVLAERYAYEGDRDSYDDLRNANLMRVIDRRRGLPVTLGILFIHAARCQGWEAGGLNFPAHFLIRLGLGGEGLILDPFDRGRPRSPSALRQLLKMVAGSEAELRPEHYAPVGNRAILLRLQNNLKMRLSQAGEQEAALGVLESMLMIAPRQSGLWYEAAQLNSRLGNLRAAVVSLEQVLDLAEDPAVLQRARGLLQRLKSRLN